MITPIVTLISDWQDKDYYIAAVKGRLYSHIPQVTIVDITHQIPASDGLATASYILRNAYKNFPQGTVHIMGVKEIESKNTPHIVASYNGHYFIAADSGQFYDIFDNPQQAEVFEITTYQEGTTFTFPSRDRFPAVAAAIINGNLSAVGGDGDDSDDGGGDGGDGNDGSGSSGSGAGGGVGSNRSGVDLSTIGVASSLRPKEKEAAGITVSKRNEICMVNVPIIYVDAAGNAILDIKREKFESFLKEYPNFLIEIKGFSIKVDRISEAYQDVSEASLCAIFLDNDYLELSLNGASFADMTGRAIRDEVRIEFKQ